MGQRDMRLYFFHAPWDQSWCCRKASLGPAYLTELISPQGSSWQSCRQCPQQLSQTKVGQNCGVAGSLGGSGRKSTLEGWLRKSSFVVQSQVYYSEPLVHREAQLRIRSRVVATQLVPLPLGTIQYSQSVEAIKMEGNLGTARTSQA